MDFPAHHFHWQTGQRAGRLFYFEDHVTDSAMLVGTWFFSEVFLALLVLPAESRLVANSIPLSLSLHFFNVRKYCGKRVIVNYLVCLFSIVYRNISVSIAKVTQYSYIVSDARTNRLFMCVYVVSWNFRYWHSCG